MICNSVCFGTLQFQKISTKTGVIRLEQNGVTKQYKSQDCEAYREMSLVMLREELEDVLRHHQL